MAKFGTIVLVPFSFTDLTHAKIRPALVVSRESNKDQDVIVCFISSKSGNSSEMPLRATKENGLKVDSFVRLDKIATLKKSIVLGELGTVNKTELAKYKETFLSVFGF